MTAIVIRPAHTLIGSPIFVDRTRPNENHLTGHHGMNVLIAECGVTVVMERVKAGFLCSGDSLCMKCLEMRTT